MDERVILCVDGGGTRSRGRLTTRDGRALFEAVAGPCNPSTNVMVAAESVAALWSQLAGAAGIAAGDAGRHALAIGAAGLVEPERRAAFLAALPPFAERILVTDGYAALIGAGSGAPSGLVILGTGAVAHRLHSDGTSFIRDGWGFLGGDRGSGAWIGHKAVRATLEARDTARAPTPLTRAVAARLGEGYGDVLAWLIRATPDRFAALVPLVIEAAGNGDALASSILDRAAAHGARLAKSLDVGGDEKLYLAGGLAAVLKARLEEKAGRVLDAPAHDAMHGAFLIATGRAPQERWG